MKDSGNRRANATLRFLRTWLIVTLFSAISASNYFFFPMG